MLNLDALIKEMSLPIVEAHTYPFPESIYLSVSKLTKYTFEGGYNDGKLHHFSLFGSRGSDQETTVQLSGLCDAGAIQTFDLAVHTAVASLIAGLPPETTFPVFIPCARIYQMLTMRTNARLSPGIEADLMARLDKLAKIRLTVRPGAKLKSECPSFAFDEPLFNGSLATGEYPNGITSPGIVLEKDPVLYRADSLIKQISKIPIDYMRPPERVNKVYLLIKLYLTKRIEWMKAHKRGKNKLNQRLILIESVKESLGDLADTVTRKSLLRVINDLLTNMADSGYIKSFAKQAGQDNLFRAVKIDL